MNNNNNTTGQTTANGIERELCPPATMHENYHYTTGQTTANGIERELGPPATMHDYNYLWRPCRGLEPLNLASDPKNNTTTVTARRERHLDLPRGNRVQYYVHNKMRRRPRYALQPDIN